MFATSRELEVGIRRRIFLLMMLRQALIEERYEECGDLVRIAGEAGVSHREVKRLLRNPEASPEI